MKRLLLVGLIVLLLPALFIPDVIVAEGEQGQQTALEALLSNPDVGPSEKAVLRAMENAPPLNEHQSEVALEALGRRFEPELLVPLMPDIGGPSALESYSNYPGSHWWELKLGQSQLFPYTDLGQHGSKLSGQLLFWKIAKSNHFVANPLSPPGVYGGTETCVVLGPTIWGSGMASAQTGQTFYVSGSQAQACQVYGGFWLDGELTVFAGATVDIKVWFLLYDFTAARWTNIEVVLDKHRSLVGTESISQWLVDGWTAYLQPGHYYWTGVQVTSMGSIYLNGMASSDFGPQDGDGSGYPNQYGQCGKWGYFWFVF